MTNRILFFSGGLSSFAVAHHLKINFPNDNILLYFTDTLWEDKDLYRFIDEVSDKLKLPLLKHSKGHDPVQLMIKQHILFNNRFGQCSLQLKMKVSMNYIKKGIKPEYEEWYNKEYLKSENYLDSPILYFGISFDEFHRTVAIKENWSPYQSEFPLCKEFYDYDELLKLYDIKKPNLYLKGFSHNNCKGRCVKAGLSHYKLLYNEDYKTFTQLENIESLLSLYVSSWHEYKNDETKLEQLSNNEIEMNKWHDMNYEYSPVLLLPTVDKHYSFMKEITLNDVKRQMDKGMRLDLFNESMGGCGCFVDYDEVEITDDD